MDLWELVRVLVRRWYLTVPLLALVALMVSVAGGRVQPTYSAESTILYVTPLASQEQTGRANPWREAGLNTTALAVQATVAGPDVRRQIAAQGLSSHYLIEQDPRSVLASVSVEATSEDLAQRSLASVIEAIKVDLAKKQDQYLVPDVGQIKIIGLTGEGTVVVTKDGYKRVVVAVGGAGLLVVVGIVLIFDAVITSGRRQRSLGDPRSDRVSSSAQSSV